MGREESFFYDFKNIFLSYVGGVAFNMRIVHPFRLSFNILVFLFVIIVPFLYFKIFKFRKLQTNMVQGVYFFSSKLSFSPSMNFKPIDP